MRLLPMMVATLGLCACSFSTPLSGPQSDDDSADAEVATRDPAALDPSATEINDCINSCRVMADEAYNLCRAQTPGSEGTCALARDRAYAACPGGCS